MRPLRPQTFLLGGSAAFWAPLICAYEGISPQYHEVSQRGPNFNRRALGQTGSYGFTEPSAKEGFLPAIGVVGLQISVCNVMFTL